MGIAVSHYHNSHYKVDRSKNWVAGAKTAVKKTIPSFYAAITHQDTGTFNQHQHSRDSLQLKCPASNITQFALYYWPCLVSIYLHFSRNFEYWTRLRGGEWRMERDFEICFIGRWGAAAWAREHKMDWTQEMLNSDVKRKLPDDLDNKMDGFLYF